MDDKSIIDLYHARDERAITESEQKYGAYCLTVSRNIVASKEDAEECVNDTWLKAWQLMPPERPTLLRLFFAKITRLISLNRYRSNRSRKREAEVELIYSEIDSCIVGKESVEETLSAKELGALLTRFVSTLPAREGNVFLRRYFYFDSVCQIAKRYGLRENHVSVILSRCRAKLKQTLSKEGYL